jgi:hypothetical protein
MIQTNNILFLVPKIMQNTDVELSEMFRKKGLINIKAVMTMINIYA